MATPAPSPSTVGTTSLCATKTINLRLLVRVTRTRTRHTRYDFGLFLGCFTRCFCHHYSKSTRQTQGSESESCPSIRAGVLMQMPVNVTRHAHVRSHSCSALDLIAYQWRNQGPGLFVTKRMATLSVGLLPMDTTSRRTGLTKLVVLLPATLTTSK